MRRFTYYHAAGAVVIAVNIALFPFWFFWRFIMRRKFALALCLLLIAASFAEAHGHAHRLLSRLRARIVIRQRVTVTYVMPAQPWQAPPPAAAPKTQPPAPPKTAPQVNQLPPQAYYVAPMRTRMVFAGRACAS